MKLIGGFFELEVGRRGAAFHADEFALTSGRSCLDWIVAVLQPARVRVPFYICDGAIGSLVRRGVEIVFHAIDTEFRPVMSPDLQADELLVHVNYFGLCKSVCDTLATEYPDRFIQDNTQAYFDRPAAATWWFNSARKFFGVPDGAYLHGPTLPPAELPYHEGIECSHLTDRWLGRQRTAYEAFQRNESAVSSGLFAMSPLSRALLEATDHSFVVDRRRSNYAVYQREFGDVNQIVIPVVEQVPYCYPLLVDRDIDRSRLADHGVFIPTLWPDVIRRTGECYSWERHLSHRLLPLPLDHRYGEDDCLEVSRKIKEIWK